MTEELLAGKGLAWLGGAAVVIGIVFFLALAIRNGLISESMRVVLAGVGSVVLGAGGMWLHQTKGQTQASLAVVGAGIAGAFATLVSATQQYHLIRPELGLLGAGLVGVAATVMAIRVGSREIAGLGIVGALLAPVLVDAGTSGLSLTYVTIALLAASVVAVMRSWQGLSLVALLVTAPQLAAWGLSEGVGLSTGLIVTALFGAVHLATAIAHALAIPAGTVRPLSAVTVSLNATLTALVGLGVVDNVTTHLGESAHRWVLGLSLVHLAAGAALAVRQRDRLIGPLVATVGFAFLAVALAMMLGGPALVVGWSAQAVVAAWLAQRVGDTRPLAGSAALLVLAVGHCLAFEAPLESLRDGVDLADAWMGLGAVIVAVIAVMFLAPADLRVGAIREQPRLRSLLLGAEAGLGLYVASVSIVELVGAGQQRAQVVLSVFWGLVGLGAVVWGLRQRVAPVRLAGLALLCLAMAKIVLYDLANLTSISRALSFVVVGLIALSGAFAYQRVKAQVEPNGSHGSGQQDVVTGEEDNV